MTVLGHDRDQAGPGVGAQRQQGQQPHRTGADDQNPIAVGDPGPQRGVHGARKRLDQYRPLVGQVRRHRVQLRTVGDQRPAPPAAGLRTGAGLQPGGQVTGGDPIAAAGVSGGAAGTGRDAPGRAAQDRVEYHPAAGRQLGAVLKGHIRLGVGHDLMPGDEGHGHQGREVERRLAGDGGEVRTADPRQPWTDRDPSLARQGRDGPVGQPQRRRRRGRGAGQGGQPTRHRPGGQVAGHGTVQLQRAAHRSAPSRDVRTRTGPPADEPPTPA